MFEELFKRRKIVPAKLLEYVFESENKKYQYRTDIMKSVETKKLLSRMAYEQEKLVHHYS